MTPDEAARAYAAFKYDPHPQYPTWSHALTQDEAAAHYMALVRDDAAERLRIELAARRRIRLHVRDISRAGERDRHAECRQTNDETEHPTAFSLPRNSVKNCEVLSPKS